MKRVFILLLLALTACLPTTPPLIPAETLAAQTLEAMPKPATPTLIPTNPPTSTPIATEGTPLPEIDLRAPGAYCLPTNTERIRAFVSRVIDAKTIEVAFGNEVRRVRYLGIDAPGVMPEIEWQGPQAIAANGRLVSGKYVILIKDVSDIDTNGNFLRYVYTDGIFVNYELVRQGFARVLVIPPDTACENALISAQVEAQQALLGIWIATPIPTWTITFTPTITLTPTDTRTPKPATPTLKPACDCTGPKLTCNSFKSQKKAQACFEYCKALGYGDIFGLDKNGNGIACEGLD